MSTHSSSGVWYLIIYNLLFIVPLLVMTYLIYKGTDPKMVERWGQSEKSWMKLASGLLMIVLACYMLFFR